MHCKTSFSIYSPEIALLLKTMTPISTLLALGVLSSVLLSGCNAYNWQNEWDGHHKHTCGAGDYLRRLKSTHDNGKEDRRWEFICGRTANLPAGNDCEWSGYLNNWDERVLVNCRNGGVIAGMESDHNDRAEDRRFKFRCCNFNYKPINCYWSNYTNQWDENMDYTVPVGKLVTGAFSFHRNDKEDRRWQFMECDIS